MQGHLPHDLIANLPDLQIFYIPQNPGKHLCLIPSLVLQAMHIRSWSDDCYCTFSLFAVLSGLGTRSL